MTSCTIQSNLSRFRPLFSLPAALCVPLLLLAQVSDSTSTTYKYYSNDEGSQIAEVDPSTRNCHVFLLEDARWFSMTRKEEITVLSDARFEILYDKCNHIAVNNSSKDETHERNHGGTDSVIIDSEANGAPQNTSEEAIEPNIFEDENLNATLFGTSSGFPLIFLGTKWCGAGDVARSIDDIGQFTETDKCCREHDHCPDNIPSKQCKHDLCNDGDYTRSHCNCDDKFLRCLKDDKTLSKIASFKIAHVYFNLLKPLCFALRHPTKECKSHRITRECLQYNYDYQQPTTWQFFPAQQYTPVTRAVKKLLNLDPLGIQENVGKVVPTLPSLPNVPSLRF